MTTQQPDPLDEIYNRCDVSNNQTDNPMSLEEFKSAINALMIPRKEVEAALKDEKEQYCCNDPECSDFWLGNDILVSNSAKADIRSVLNIKPEGKQLEAKEK